VQCDVCPRACRLHEGQRGFCQHAITTALAPWTTAMTLPGFAQPPLDTAERPDPGRGRGLV
jgi:hypothetical protein